MILNIKCFVTQQHKSICLYSGRYACSCKAETEMLCIIYMHLMSQGITKHDINCLRGRNEVVASGFHRSCYCLQGNGFGH
jgi:hypothetical protein